MSRRLANQLSYFSSVRLFLSHNDCCFLQTQCVQVLSRDKHVLLWVVYSSSVPEGQIACNPIFSRLVGLEEGWDVFVSPYGDIKVLDELYIDTDSPDDQEILVSKLCYILFSFFSLFTSP